MATQDTDISWQVLRQIVHDWAGASAELDEVKTLGGGSVATTVALRTRAGDRAVLKLTQHRADRAYADEAHQLNTLRQAGMPTPEVYRCEIGTLDRPFSYLLIQFLDGIDLARMKSACSAAQFNGVQEELAALVREMHAQTDSHYQRVTAHDSPTRFDDWPALYRDAFTPIWQEAEKNHRLTPKSRKLIGKLHDRLPQLLGGRDCPRLLHGDLWSGNILVKPDDAGVWHVSAILDPSSRYGDAESEIAYMELFHTVNTEFLRAYQRDVFFHSDYHRVRKPVYHLFELLNHLQLFGSEYLKPTLSAVERVAHLV